MTSVFHLKFLGTVVLSAFLLFSLGVHAQQPGTSTRRNETITQGSALVTWRGEWRVVNDSRAVGGQYSVAGSEGASAEFRFTGVAIYFEAPLFPFPIRSLVSLDGRAPITIDLQDRSVSEGPRSSNATVQARISERGVWTGLENVEHRVRVSVPVGERAAVFDNFIITRCTGDCAPVPPPTSTITRTDPEPSETPGDSLLPDDEDGDGDEGQQVDENGNPIVTSTVTTVEILPPLTQTVIVVSETLSPTQRTGGGGSSSDSPNSEDGGGSGSSSGPSRTGLAIGFGVAFGVIMLVLIIGIAWWLIRRRRMMGDSSRGPSPSLHESRPVSGSGGGAGHYAVAGAAAAAASSRDRAPEIREVSRERELGGGPEPQGSPFVGMPAGSGTATPMSTNVAGIGVRDVGAIGRRHSYNGGPKKVSTGGGMAIHPYAQPEPWADR